MGTTIDGPSRAAVPREPARRGASPARGRGGDLDVAGFAAGPRAARTLSSAQAPGNQASAGRGADAEDAVLVARAERGDRTAFDELFRRHAHPAWRVALAVGGSAAAAEQAVAEGFTAAFRTRAGGSGLTTPFRLLVVRATIEAASAEAASGVAPPFDSAPNPTVEMLRALPVLSRAVLWLLEAESGTPEQVGAVVGIGTDEVAGVAARAAATIERGPARRSSSRRDALRALVVPMPAGLAGATAAWWTAWQTEAEAAKRRRIGAGFTIAPLTERIVGAAAATVLAAGVAAALALGDRRGGSGPAVASAADGENASGAPSSSAIAPSSSPIVGPSVPAPPAVPKGSARTGARSLAATAANRESGPAGAPGPTATLVGGATPPPAPRTPVGPAAMPPGPATPPAASVDLGANVAGTPLVVEVDGGGLGIQAGGTVVGNPSPAPATPSIVITTGFLPPISVPLP